MLTPLEVVSWFVVVTPLEVAEAVGAPGVGRLQIRRQFRWSRCHSLILLVVKMVLSGFVVYVVPFVVRERVVALGFVVV